MNVKIEDASPDRIRKLDAQVERILSLVPAEHLRGFTKLVFVDLITEPRISSAQRSGLPALYHPRAGGQMAWGEVATSVLIPKKKFHQRLMSRLTLKPNLAQVILSLIAQHYYLTLSKGIKKNQLEYACRTYTEKYFEKWRDSQGGIRMWLTKPFRPYLDKLAKKLSKKYKQEAEKKKLQQQAR
jgi:hypothetical protein